MRANLPERQKVSRRGVFEISGPLQYVFAVGQIPGGQFQPVDIVCKGHLLYLFEGEGCRKPTSKPRGFFNIKRAEVTFIGLLQNPPLPPFTNVFKLTFASKQMAHKDWFFKAKTNREVNQWVADLSWRVKASEAQLDERFEPRELTAARLQKPRRLMDETETAVTRPPTQVLGFLVRYEPKAVAEEVRRLVKNYSTFATNTFISQLLLSGNQIGRVGAPPPVGDEDAARARRVRRRLAARVRRLLRQRAEKCAERRVGEAVAAAEAEQSELR